MTVKANGKLIFLDNEGKQTKVYDGSSDVTLTGSDIGQKYVGVGAVSVTDTDNSHEISISLDKAAGEAGKSIAESSITDIIGFLGGTAVPPSQQ